MSTLRELAPFVFIRRHRKVATLVVVGIVSCIAFASHIGIASAQTGTVATQEAVGLRSITATGAGMVTAVTDRLFLNIVVDAFSIHVTDALKANNNSTHSLLVVLKSKGIDDRDIKTSQVSINPQFDTAGSWGRAYRVSNSVTVTVREIETSGDLIDAAANVYKDAVANVPGDAIRIESLSFAVSDPSASLVTARDRAVKDATTKAGQMAKSAGVKLGKLRSIRSGGDSGPSPVYRTSAVAAPNSTPTFEGTQAITASVELVFDIQDE
jgi:uncharacterized protein